MVKPIIRFFVEQKPFGQCDDGLGFWYSRG